MQHDETYQEHSSTIKYYGWVLMLNWIQQLYKEHGNLWWLGLLLWVHIEDRASTQSIMGHSMMIKGLEINWYEIGYVFIGKGQKIGRSKVWWYIRS